VHPQQLHLDEVKRLFQQAGRPWPDAEQMEDVAFLQALIDGLCTLSLLDSLTGVANRRAFNALMSQELDRVARAGESALLLTVDIDHFKQINDTYGHAAGDDVIKAVARSLVETVRPMDTVARIGGEEFAVVLSNCGPGFGAVVAERIRTAVECMRVVHHGQVLAVTVSGGGAFAPPWVRSSPDNWMARADEQLYRAKREGRNRMCLEPTLSSDVSAEEKGLLFAWGSSESLMINSTSPN
jgi:diguanylate cyclase (GGDEF)-like protein